MEFITVVFERGDYLAALAATVASFALGFVWYHPKTFGTIWMEGVGLTEEDSKKANMPVIFGANFVVTFLAALALSALFTRHAGAVDGLKAGLMVGIFWGATTHVMHTLYELRSARTIGIGALHDVVHFGLIGLVLGLF
jgi:hypothetical protein